MSARRTPAGRFITLEGGEGAGKSTLAAELEKRLTAAGRIVVRTREPGGSPSAEVLRHVLLSGAARPLGPFAEAILFAAARDDHLESVIRPALQRGDIVLCDRFADSTRAYQGAVGGVPVEVVDALERVVVGRTKPDLTLVLDVPPSLGLARVEQRSAGADRFEREKPEFHERLRQAYLAIAEHEPTRCAVVDATVEPEAVAEAAWRVVVERLKLARGGAKA